MSQTIKYALWQLKVQSTTYTPPVTHGRLNEAEYERQVERGGGNTSFLQRRLQKSGKVMGLFKFRIIFL